MALSPGARVGAYEIVSPLGVGGMGEVYRARDTRLKRDVAIKVLPDLFSQDADRLARFQREAELLAALNHPNIAAIYGLEKTEAGTAIILELVDGETLAEVITRGAVPLDDALPIARAIADALEAAHDKGIVHRDLKPANIKITSEGKIKVLDFGLAKAVDQAAGSGSLARDQLTASPTLSLHATYAGVIMGTAAYMSPEQARGKAVDRRTDIWSFGCVLHEMLTGKQTFDAGETVSDAIAAILKHDPDWSALPVDTPPHIRTLLRRCLQKDLQKRLPHIGVARLEIDEQPAEAVVARTSPPSTRPPWRRLLPSALAAGAAALLAIGLTVWTLRSTVTTPLVTRLMYVIPESRQFGPFLPLLAISRDGSRMVYAVNQRLYLKSMSDLAARAIGGTDVEEAGNIGNPVFSPDGESIVYWSRTAASPGDTGALKRIRLDGSAAVTLAQIRRPLGMSWSGHSILAGQPPPTGIVRISDNGGTPEQIVSAKSDELMQGPQMLPGGNAVLFTVGIATASAGGLTSDETWNKAQIVVQDLKSGTRTMLIAGGTAAHYLPTGHLVYAVGGVLMARTFDAQRLALSGGSIPVVEGVSQARLGQFSAGSLQMSVSDTGTLIYMPGPPLGGSGDQRDLVVVDRAGAVETLKLPSRPYQHPRVSPNGKQLAYHTDDGKEAIVWIYDLSGATSPRRLTSEGANRFPVWSHDGQRIAFQSDRDGELAIYSQVTNGEVPAERLVAGEQGMSIVPDSWTEKELFFQKSRNTATSGPNRQELRTEATLWTFTIAQKTAAPVGAIRSVVGIAPIGATVSPDGRWLAYIVGTDASRAALQIWVRSLTNGAQYQIATGAVDPQWSPDGKVLFFNSLVGGGALAVPITTQPHFEAGNATPLPAGVTSTFRGSRPGPGTARNIDIMPDGQHFVAAVGSGGTNAGPQQIDVVLNWFEELKTRVPRN